MADVIKQWYFDFRLNFDNSAYRYIQKEDDEEQEILPITSDFFFEVFPFNIVFRQVTFFSSRLITSHLISNRGI